MGWRNLECTRVVPLVHIVSKPLELIAKSDFSSSSSLESWDYCEVVLLPRCKVCDHVDVPMIGGVGLGC